MPTQPHISPGSALRRAKGDNPAVRPACRSRREPLDNAPTSSINCGTPDQFGLTPVTPWQIAEAKPETSAMDKSPRAGSKLAIIVELLARPEGATISEMAGATGWQEHSVRGALSGILAKRYGVALASEVVEGRGRVYRRG